MAVIPKNRLALKPLVAMITLANAQMAFGCADVVVNSLTDVPDDVNITSFEEALTETGLCGSITIDDSLAGQTLSLSTTSISMDSSKTLTITGPATLATLSVAPASFIQVQESSTLLVNNLRFVPSLDSTREVSLIRVSSNSALSLDNVVVSGFDSTAYGGAINSGGVTTIRDSLFSDNSSRYRGGAIDSWDAELTIEDSVFENNQASADSANSAGGAISAVGERGSGVITIRSSEFRGNQARNYGGAIYQSIGNSIEITDTLFEDNQVFAASNEFGTGATAEAHGGALTVDRSTEVVIQQTTFKNNSATNYGGALYIGRSGRSGTVTIEDSTFDGNLAKISSSEGTLALGGAIYADAPATYPVTVSVKRSTLVGNTAEGSGGALYLTGADLVFSIESSTIADNISASQGGAMTIWNASSALTIAHSTITGNQTIGSGVYDAGVIYANSPGDIEIGHTVIAGNTQGNAAGNNICVAESSGSAVNVNYSFWDELFSAGDCVVAPATATSVVEDGADPGLDDLADNGGYTLTRYPAANSVLVNSGNPSIMDEPSSDQRGSCRIEGGVIDIGAVEYGNQPAVSSDLDDLSITVGQVVVIDGSEAFTDPDGDTLTYSLSGAPVGMSIDASSGVVSGTAVASGFYLVKVIAADSCGAKANASFSLTVKEDSRASSGSSSGGGGSLGFFVALLAPLAWWRRSRR